MRAFASLLVAAALVAGCATSTPGPYAARVEPGAEPAYQRCSSRDPDRSAWFCVIGQILYAVVAGMEAGVDIRPK
jgi:hypothetical protein